MSFVRVGFHPLAGTRVGPPAAPQSRAARPAPAKAAEPPKRAPEAPAAPLAALEPLAEPEPARALRRPHRRPRG